MRLFRIYVDGALFYHPHLSKLAVTKAEVKEDAENIDSLTLSAPYNHPYLAAIRPMASAIVCKKGNQTVFEPWMMAAISITPILGRANRRWHI